jgi:hypothetical protein
MNIEFTDYSKDFWEKSWKWLNDRQKTHCYKSQIKQT